MNPVVPVYSHRMRVGFAETDLAGIVHFSNFFRYMENAEHAFYRSLGFSVHPRSAESEHGKQCFPGIGWPRVSASCDYRRPLRFEEELTVEVCLKDIRSKTIHYEFRFVSDDSDEPAAVGSLTVICVTYDPDAKRMRAVEIPQEIRNKIKAAADAA